MAIGIKTTSNVDLDTIFKARTSAKRADVGIYYNNGGSKTDISNRFETSIGGDQIASNTGIKGSGGSDLKSLFQDYNYVAAPSITTQPTNQTVASGNTATFTVAATGAATLTYQWKKWNGSSYANVSVGSGGTTTSYSISGAVDANEGTFIVTVTNGYGSVDSSSVTLTVQTPPSITAHPTNVYDADGVSQNLSVFAAGDATLTYQWQKDSSGWSNVSGATSATYIFTMGSSTAGTYRCVVSNSYGSVNSNSANVVVEPEITDISGEAPAAGWVYFALSVGNVAAFGCTYLGAPSVSWAWYEWDGSTYNVISGETTSSYTAGALSPAGTYYWKVIASNAAGSHSVEIEVIVT